VFDENSVRLYTSPQLVSFGKVSAGWLALMQHVSTELLSDGLGIVQSFILLEFAVHTVNAVFAPSFCYRPHFGLLLAGSYRFSYTEVAEGSAGQVPGAEVASSDKAASGGKVGPAYICRHPLLLR
jgi:hypothetical protein